MTFRLAASEFPNDNPELHDGAVFVCLSLCAPPRAIWRPRAEAAPVVAIPPPVEAEPALPVEAELTPAEAEPVLDVAAAPPPPDDAEPAPAAEAEPEPPQQMRDAFADFIQALVDVALHAGATRAAIMLPDLLESGTICCDSTQAEALAERGVLERTSAGLVPKQRLVETGRAWRQVLRGESDDLSACGASTLDAWGAELLGMLAGKSASACEEFRRELRRRGVAAFGMLSLAA